MGDAVVAQGCGQMLLGRQSTAQGLVHALNAVTSNREMAERAKTLSIEIQARGPQRPVEKILQACYEALEGSCCSTPQVRAAH
ncbi:MAG: hypothetical protein R3212_02535, partial [Xanthomonadales bacterium]|nr:hypothetical protein [Xanthomonadales bacterium]